MENWFLPNTASALPPARRVLVLAPHPDDEVFGCGGCAALYAQAGATVQPHILTDGGGYLAGAARQTAVELRRGESRRASALLGVAEPSFGVWEDRSLSAQSGLAAHVRDQIESLEADVVFAPSLWEVHPDHRAAAWATVKAASELHAQGKAAPLVAFYEVGAALRPNHLVDISAVLDIKKQAMATFESQLAQQRYDLHIAALNIFRSYTLPGVNAAEALIVVPASQMAQWASSYAEDAPPGLAQVTEAALQKADGVAEAFQHIIVGLNGKLNEQGDAIATLNNKVAEITQVLHLERDQAETTRRELSAVIEEQGRQLALQHKALEQNQQDLAELRDQSEQRRMLAQSLAQSLADVHASRSWKVTRPLRWVSEKLR